MSGIKIKETNDEASSDKSKVKNVYVGRLFYFLNDIEDPNKVIEEKSNRQYKELEILENIFHKKLSNDYLQKLSDLLYRKGDPNYISKRKKMNEIKYTYDENHNPYLTLSKFGNKSTEESEGVILPSLPSINNNKYNHLNTGSDNDINKENDNECDYSRMRVNTLPNCNVVSLNKNIKFINQEYIPKELNETEKRKIIDNLTTKTNFHTNLAKSQVKYKTRIKLENKKNINDLSIFNSVERLKQKKIILKKMDHTNNFSKLRLIDFFHLDKKWWANQNIDYKKIEKEKKEKLIQDQIKGNIKMMNDDSKFLERIAFCCENKNVEGIEEELKKFKKKKKNNNVSS